VQVAAIESHAPRHRAFLKRHHTNSIANFHYFVALITFLVASAFCSTSFAQSYTIQQFPLIGLPNFGLGATSIGADAGGNIYFNQNEIESVPNQSAVYKAVRSAGSYTYSAVLSSTTVAYDDVAVDGIGNLYYSSHSSVSVAGGGY
jgi:hypothetical protein